MWDHVHMKKQENKNRYNASEAVISINAFNNTLTTKHQGIGFLYQNKHQLFSHKLELHSPLMNHKWQLYICKFIHVYVSRLMDGIHVPCHTSRVRNGTGYGITKFDIFPSKCFYSWTVN